MSWRVVDAEVDAEQSLTVRARYDELSGLISPPGGTRRAHGILSHPTRQGCELVVAFCDVDNIKSVNDTLGHAAGGDVRGLRARSGERASPSPSPSPHADDDIDTLIARATRRCTKPSGPDTTG